MSRTDALKEIESNIAEISMMIDHFIQLKDRGVSYAAEEIAYWRKMLQSAKIQKRRLLNT